MRFAIVVAAHLVAAATATGVAGYTSDVLHVSPDGRGSLCTAQAPCALTTARDRVRQEQGDVVVELSGGTYRLTSAFTLGPQDSGRPGHSVVYRAAAGQHPVFSGATRVTGFTKVDAAKNIYRAKVPKGSESRDLFVDGTRAQRTRSAVNPPGFSTTATGFTTADGSYADWTNQSQVEVVNDNAWKQMRCPLASITRNASGGSDLMVDPGCWNNNHSNVPNPGFPFNGAGLPTLNGISWIENAYQLLGTPGQFYLDGAAGYLYYVPRPGQNLAKADVELPTTQELVVTSAARPATSRRSTTATGGPRTPAVGVTRTAGRWAISAATCTTPAPTGTPSATPSPAPASRCCRRPTPTRARSTSTWTAPRRRRSPLPRRNALPSRRS
ncbi:hypothetical protein [Kutzneria kofuensis]|uniref:hypothetical protein n=1 Tax=Kutzneria kofuensis TaxID=103725 RepID=UPI0031EDBACA